jgi:SAM-dependent methyltransferase
MKEPAHPGYDEAIKQHYDRVAEYDKDSSTSTMADTFVRETETAFIANKISEYTHRQETAHRQDGGYALSPGKNNRFSVLDVGCGNGHTLETMSESFPHFDFAGIEFNASLRNIAANRFRNRPINISEGDIRVRASLPQTRCDILICQRVIINLLDAADQKATLSNLIEIVNPNGLLIFIEAFKSGLSNLNEARSEFGLEGLPPASHNLYLDDDFFIHPTLAEFDNSKADFLSTHYFVSRVLHQTFLNVNKGEFVRNSHFVSFLSRALPHSIGKYSPLKLLAFNKK